MRKLLVIAAALGLFAALSAPSIAATNDLSAKKHSAAYCKKHPKAKGCAMKKMDKKSELGSTVFSAKKKTMKKHSAAYCKKHPKAKGCHVTKKMTKKHVKHKKATKKM
jgi:hypothetical protein